MNAGTTRTPTSGVTTVAGTAVWRAAWRQHRIMTGVSVGIVAATGLLVTAQILVLPDCVPDHTASFPGCWELSDRLQYFPMLRTLLTFVPVLIGLVVGISVFARDFERGTQVYALTQQVGRLRWWAAATVVSGTPVLAALLVLGLGTGRAFGAHRGQLSLYTSTHAMAWPELDTVGVLPATWFLVAFALAVTAGLVIRSSIGGLVVAGVLVAGAIIWSLDGRQDLVPHESVTQPLQTGNSAVTYWPLGDWHTESYAVDDRQLRIDFPTCPDAEAVYAAVPPEGLDEEAAAVLNKEYEKRWLVCWERAGITGIVNEYIPAAAESRMRWTLAGVHLVTAGAVLALGAVSLRRRDLR